MGTILIVTPNPSIDRTEVVAQYRLGQIHRPLEVLALPGGKGLNVARAVRRLGGDVLACTLLAGYSGAWMANALQNEGIPVRVTWLEAGETRHSICVLDSENRVLTEIYENGVPVKASEWEQFEQMIAASLDGVTLAAFSGALPPGAPTDGYARLVRLVQQQSIPAILDTRGKFLREGISAKPFLVKVNVEEAGEILEREIVLLEDTASAAKEIRDLGIDKVILTMGKKGAIAASENGAVYAPAPPVESLCAVGSGDSFLGGLAYSLQRGESYEQALKMGVAVGTANTLTIGAGIFGVNDVLELAEKITLTQL